MKKLIDIVSGCIIAFIVGILFYGMFIYKMPVRVHETQKSGVYIKDSITNNGEWYVFSNLTGRQKVILGFNFTPMSPQEPEPFLKVVLPPWESTTIDVPSQLTDQIRICELDCVQVKIIPLSYINAERLRNGYKD